MRFTILTIALLLFLFQSCIKIGTTVYSVNSGMKSAFNYKPGSYWIYKDSITGAIDSAYVTSNQDLLYNAGGCVLEPNAPKIENIGISVFVSDGNPSDTEQWYFSMQQSQFNIGFHNSKDSVESTMGFSLFTWPLATGMVGGSSGCVPGFDSGSVADIIPEVELNGQSYDNAARSVHAPFSERPQIMVYNDCFYVNQEAGIIKLTFIHPADSVHRVLELQRYHIVR